MLPHPLTNFEIQKYYENESTFNGVYSRNNLPKIIHGAYIINLDEYESVETHWIALYANDNNVTYFDIALEFNILQKKLENSLEIQAYDSTMCGYSIGFIGFMLKGKSLSDHTN